MKIIVIALLSVLYMSCGWTDGNSVSRWGMLVAVLAMVYVLLYFFPEKKKIIVTVGVIVVVVAIIVGTFFKRVSHGMDISVCLFSFFSQVLLQKSEIKKLGGAGLFLVS